MSNFIHLVACVALAGACAQPASGEPPAAVATITGTVLVLDGGKPVKGKSVWVFLEESPRRHTAQLGADWQPQHITQRGETFEPHVVVVPIGATVSFPNLDHEEHNVFSPDDPPGDFGRYNYDEKGKSHKFTRAQVLDIYCDIHVDMSAKIKVVDSRWIAPVGADGHFEISAPPGSYKVVAWTPDSKEVRSDQFTVGAGERHALGADDLHLQRGEPPGTHKRKDGSPYCPYRECK
jgi:plastocyanin